MSNSRRFSLILFGLMGLAPLMVYLGKYPLSPRRDWDYFNSLSLMIGNSLSKGVLPLIDPWVCGGIDMLANPQNWVYSPFALFSLFLSPYLANVFSLLACAGFGFAGMLKLTEENDSWINRLLISSLFCLSPFFFLHFAEGHITFRTFYFLPWILYFSRHLNLRNLWLMNVCLAFMFLDGGIYPFYYSLVLILINLEWNIYKELLTNRKSRSLVAIMTLSFVLVLFAKALPVLLIHEKRVPQHEAAWYSLSNFFHALYDVRQSNFLGMEGQSYAFHEYGHYIGIGLTLLILVSLKNARKNLKVTLQIFLFAWIAFGLGGDINPWLLIKQIPFIKHLHVQSRFLIMLYLMLLILISKWESHKKAKTILLTVALVELLGVGFYISTHSFKEAINSQTIVLASKNVAQSHYMRHISKPEIYSTPNSLSYQCYEPANPNRLKNSNLLFSAPGLSAQIEDNQITIFDNEKRTESYVMNYNWNGGWICEGCETRSKQGLIEVIPDSSGKDIILTYKPVHFKLSIGMLLVGLMIFVFTLSRIRKLHGKN